MNIKQNHSRCMCLWWGLLCLLMLCPVREASAESNPDRKKPWVVAAVNFSGNSSISSNQLLSVMGTKPGSFFRAVKFSPSILTSDLEAISAAYLDNGFMKVTVSTGEVVKDPVSRKVTVDFVISEGFQTHIDSVEIRGVSGYAQDQINKYIWSKRGKPLSPQRIVQDQQSICDSLIALGNLLCVVGKKESVDSATHTASILFTIDPGPTVLTDSIVLIGAQKLHQSIILRGLTVESGDTLTSKRIALSVRQLYETGMFKYVQISVPVTDSLQLRKISGSIRLPVVLTIEEADFFKIQGGIGYGTFEGPRVSLQTSYGNIAGLGRTLGMDGKYSRIIQSLHLGYTAPWVFMLPPTAVVDVYGEHHDEVTFIGYLEGLRLSLSVKTQWNSTVWLFTQFEWVQGVAALPPVINPGTIIHANNTQSFGVGLSYDIRDNIFDPSKGFFVTSDAEVAGLIGQETNHFYKFLIDARAFLPVTKYLTAVSAINAAYINGYGSDVAMIPPQELLYAGSYGIRGVRGYSPGDLGDAAGGKVALVLNLLELRFSIVKWLVLASFADAGYVWTEDALVDVRTLYVGVGPGIRLRTPVGLISGDLGVRLSGSSAGQIGLSINIGNPF